MTNEMLFPVELRYTEQFKKDLKKLKKKYRNIKKDLEECLKALQEGKLLGDKIPGTDYAVYKVRLKNSDANRGKSGGYRLIYYIAHTETRWLLTIYSKSDQPDIAPHQIQAIIKELSESVSREAEGD